MNFNVVLVNRLFWPERARAFRPAFLPRAGARLTVNIVHYTVNAVTRK
jgi:hypothetical protein